MSDRFIAHYRQADGATQPLQEHLVSVAIRAARFAKKIRLADLGELLGMLHDLGKYSDEFHTYIKSAVGMLRKDEDEEFVDAVGLRGKVDHSTAGAQLIWRECSKRWPRERIIGQILALPARQCRSSR